MPPLDHDRCYAAAASRDARFDGWFVTAVRTTGIYCRPSCPAITPKQTNVEFHHTAAAAQQRGFRACKRCRPDATPGSPDWNIRQDVVGRAMRLIADGVVERVGVPGLARQLGYSERHLNRLLTDEVGAGPLAVARAQRAQTARILIETTELTLTDVAFAAGFGSVRQFNDTIREVFAAAPSELRAASATRRDADGAANGAASVQLRLPTRPPFAAVEVLDFIGGRAIPGSERYDGADDQTEQPAVYRRVLDLPGGHGIVDLRTGGTPDAPAADHLVAKVVLTDWADLGTAVHRLRRLFDLDADPQAVDEHLRSQADLAPLVELAPGRRAPASVDPYETAVRAIIGQQISVAGARTVAGRIVEAVGAPLAVDDPVLTHAFPTPAALAEAPDDAFSMPTARRDTIRRLAAAVADGSLRLDVGVDPQEARARLLGLKGIGPWTADYVVMRGLGHPDTPLGGDLGVVHALRALGLDDRSSSVFDACAPWRSYAVHHLWASLDQPPTTSKPTTSKPTTKNPVSSTRTKARS
ncbi:DNA-3-methyladenine glycosylase 2 family protein [Ilumatobacter coccineus]|uniref:DNA-3-methyladenine glycosylase II n=1 Tax=Ilumatobacter coccineus (strain NBRC 103263 / KCTC 29153 / YM16-304) TaxID=1313172 RepID=A0A6C7E3Q8_ILUCY|nr:DNA-3-methyladenine glycosylase 2 family protein [Ilumatobacter coccineus]BAN01330.1 putative 3-methyladenine DNA glycosylase [Ilumatobacter coccineus YM16-304]